MNFKPTQHARSLPVIQMTALIDILFVILSFFMAVFLNFNFESELNISVPQAKASIESKMAAEEIVINVGKEGQIVVNQKPMTVAELEELLRKTSDLYPGQAVILRADQKAYHEYVVAVLDACAKAKIWNVSFATTKE